MFEYRIFVTKAGYVGIVASRRGLRRVYLPHGSRRVLTATVRREFPGACESGRLLNDLVEALRRYFAGQPVEFDVPLDLRGASRFEAAVWRACQKVAYGQCVTYKQLAERVGRPNAARAIGMAMRRNPWPIVVPCHRVVRSDGGLGGYSGPGGPDFKLRLLEMERNAAAVRAPRRVLRGLRASLVRG